MADGPHLRPKFWALWLLWRTILLVRPRSVPALYHLGNAYAHQGLSMAAVQTYRSLLRYQPHHLQALRNLTATLLKAGGGAEEALSAWISADPGAYEPWLHLGLAQERAGRIDDALCSYRSAAAIKPNWVEAHKRLALLYARSKRWAECQTEACRWCELANDSPDGLIVLAKASAQNGDQAQATAASKRIRALRQEQGQPAGE